MEWNVLITNNLEQQTITHGVKKKTMDLYFVHLNNH